MDGGMKSWALFLLKFLLTVGCLIWAFSGVDFQSTIFSRPQELELWWLLAGLVPAGLAVGLTAFRWGLFLSAQDIRLPFNQLLKLTLIGNFFSLASFGSLGGDAARIVLLNREIPKRKIAIAMAVMMDHLSGLVAMALMFFLLTVGRFQELGEQSVLGKGALHFTAVYLGGGMLLFLIGFVIMSPLVHGRVHRGGRWIRWEFMRALPEAWDRYRRKWKHALAGVGVSCVMLASYYLTFWAGARAVGCDVSVGTMFAAMPVIDGISTIPVSVSGLGVREKLFEVLLADLAGIAGAVAVSASLAGFFLHVGWSLIGAFLFFRGKGSVTVREIRESKV